MRELTGDMNEEKISKTHLVHGVKQLVDERVPQEQRVVRQQEAQHRDRQVEIHLRWDNSKKGCKIRVAALVSILLSCLWWNCWRADCLPMTRRQRNATRFATLSTEGGNRSVLLPLADCQLPTSHHHKASQASTAAKKVLDGRGKCDRNTIKKLTKPNPP